MKFTLVPHEHIPQIWNQVRDYLQPAVENSNVRWSMEHLCAALCMGRSQLWVAYDENLDIYGALTTEIMTYPTKKALAIHFLGGKDFDLWYPDALETLSEYGRQTGCDCLEAVARFGFWKWFEPDGWNKTAAFYEKDLNDE